MTITLKKNTKDTDSMIKQDKKRRRMKMKKTKADKIRQVDRLIKDLESRLSIGQESTYMVNSYRLDYLMDYKKKLSPKSKSPATNYKVDNEGVRSRESGGQTEYHTSYGWFNDEQIENLQSSRYFND